MINLSETGGHWWVFPHKWDIIHEWTIMGLPIPNVVYHQWTFGLPSGKLTFFYGKSMKIHPFCWENPQKFYGHYGHMVTGMVPRARSPKDHPFSTNSTDEYPNDGTHIPGKPLFLGKMRGFHRWKQFFIFFAQGGDIPSTISQLRTSRTSKPSKSGRARTCRDFSPKKRWYNWDIEGYRIGKLIG